MPCNLYFIDEWHHCSVHCMGDGITKMSLYTCKWHNCRIKSMSTGYKCTVYCMGTWHTCTCVMHCMVNYKTVPCTVWLRDIIISIMYMKYYCTIQGVCKWHDRTFYCFGEWLLTFSNIDMIERVAFLQKINFHL